jgi:hypothetical protein
VLPSIETNAFQIGQVACCAYKMNFVHLAVRRNRLRLLALSLPTSSGLRPETPMPRVAAFSRLTAT